MMENGEHTIYLEVGQKKVFAAAVDWPGWCRHGRDEETAVQSLLTYAPKYARLLDGSGLTFVPPQSPAELTIVARVPGNNTTDFGAPDQQIASDDEPFDEPTRARAQTLLEAYWRAFDAAVATAVGHELRKGPRGGGRELDGIVDHVLEVEASYLRKLGGKFTAKKDDEPDHKLVNNHP